MRKILFLCPYYFDLYKVFQRGMEKYSGCDVDIVVYKKDKFEYDGLQCIQNFFAKKFLGKNLKLVWKSRANIEGIAHPEQYDYMFVVCPENLHSEHLQYLCSKVGRSTVYYWDGFGHFPKYRDTVQHFDMCYSFDLVDVEVYGLNFITNFCFEEQRDVDIENDFLSTYDSRFPDLVKIVRSFERQHMQVSVHQYTPDRAVIERHKGGSIQFSDQPVAFTKVNEMMKGSSFVLDLQKSIQRGLTFRVFEAMGLRKKLITTNADVVNYDFYHPDNIFV